MVPEGRVNLRQNEKGIVLVTTLMLTLLGLGIILCLLYMVTGSTKMSGMNKRYKTTLEATYGGAEIMVKDMIPFILRNYSSHTLASTFVDSDTGFGKLSPTISSMTCLQQKIKYATSAWPAACLNLGGHEGLPPSKAPDITFSLKGTNDTTFLVYAQIVGTKPGNTDMGGLELEGGSTSETSSAITPLHLPYLYTIEAQGKKKGDNSATSNLEVLYAY